MHKHAAETQPRVAGFPHVYISNFICSPGSTGSSPNSSAYCSIIIRAVEMSRFPATGRKPDSTPTWHVPSVGAVLARAQSPSLPIIFSLASALQWSNGLNKSVLRSLKRPWSFRFTEKSREFQRVPLWKLNTALITLSSWGLWTLNKQRPVFMQILLVIKR